MAVGFFMGIRSSYTESAQGHAHDFIAAINCGLRGRGCPPYAEPPNPPEVYDGSMFGRSALDHDSARLIISVAQLATAEKAPNLSLLAANPYRVAFLPIPLPMPFQTAYSEEFFGQRLAIWVGSSSVLLAEVLALAKVLGIPLEEGSLTDTVAARINEYQPLFPGDAVDPNSDLRTTWLLLHEGARLSSSHAIALSLAG